MSELTPGALGLNLVVKEKATKVKRVIKQVRGHAPGTRWGRFPKHGVRESFGSDATAGLLSPAGARQIQWGSRGRG